ncbi:MAG: hypothetical protein AAB724_02500 [Patescibacteria group bacterium]
MTLAQEKAAALATHWQNYQKELVALKQRQLKALNNLARELEQKRIQKILMTIKKP